VNKYAREMPTLRPSLRGRLLREAAELLAPRELLVMRGPATRRRVALSFDDGPEEMLPRYLDALDAGGARATFFLLGECCARRPASVLEIVRRGHEVASHGFTHKRFTLMSRAELDDELNRTYDLLPVARTVRPLLRPPQGATSLRSLARSSMRGYTTVLWSLDSDDCRTQDPAALIEKCAPKNVAPGEILLLHEGQEWTLAALPAIIANLRDDDYELVPVGELLGG
jgi:peptidoglycan/xylan/chitin deacetylase (PgdA/CDA1 family)